MTLIISSPTFEDGGKIPSKYTCDSPVGEQAPNPPLEITGVPPGIKTLVLIMDDPDIPDFVKQKRGIDVFDHWVIFNIRITNKESGIKNLIIEEGKEPEGVNGVNSAGENKYRGPCPPDREHRYFFKIYALDKFLDLDEGATKKEVEETMEGHIVARAQLIGLYERK